MNVDESYAECRRLARRAASSFYLSFFLLPREKRQAMFALYAFLRHTDDLGDSQAPVEARREALKRWQQALADTLAKSFNRDPTGSAPAKTPNQSHTETPRPLARAPRWAAVKRESATANASLLPALADTAGRFRIPHEYLFDAVDGVMMDLDRCRYATFDELEQYCYRVAGVVGLACIHIWGYRSQQAFAPARACGLAFQLTNILRDLKEDAARGRIYLPLEDLAHFGLDEEDLLAGRCDEPFRRLMRFEIQRAERLYGEAGELHDYLSPEGRRTFRVMHATYRRLLAEIERQGGDVFHRPVRLRRWQKLQIAAAEVFSPGRPHFDRRGHAVHAGQETS